MVDIGGIGGGIGGGRNTQPRHVGIINSRVVVIVVGICPKHSIIVVLDIVTSPNIPGNYKIDILINNFAAVSGGDCYITPVIGGVDSSATIIGKQIPNVPGSLSGVFILTIPAKTTLTFNVTILFYSTGGTITIIRM